MMSSDRERDRRSLQDLAKLASLTPAPNSVRPSNPGSVGQIAPASAASVPVTSVPKFDDDSGVVDLAAVAAADPQAQERSQSTKLASAGLFDDTAGPAVAAQPVPTMPPASVASVAPAAAAPVTASVAPAPAAAAPAATAPAAVTGKKGSSLGLVLGLVAASAAAAGGFLYMKGHAPAPKAESAQQTTAPAVVAQAEAPKPAAAAPAPAAEPTVDPNALPAEAPAETKTAAHSATATKGTTTAKGTTAAAAKPAEPTKDEPKLAAKDIPPAPTGPVGALGDEMRKAVGANDSAQTTTAAGPTGPAAGSVPQKPSQGAITGALGAVLPQARACLGPDDPISRASVVFASSGTVQSVSVSGGAAGKPAAECIKTALMKAKVAPFAEATYSAPVTIRH